MYILTAPMKLTFEAPRHRENITSVAVVTFLVTFFQRGLLFSWQIWAFLLYKLMIVKNYFWKIITYFLYSLFHVNISWTWLVLIAYDLCTLIFLLSKVCILEFIFVWFEWKKLICLKNISLQITKYWHVFPHQYFFSAFKAKLYSAAPKNSAM